MIIRFWLISRDLRRVGAGDLHRRLHPDRGGVIVRCARVRPRGHRCVDRPRAAPARPRRGRRRRPRRRRQARPRRRARRRAARRRRSTIDAFVARFDLVSPAPGVPETHARDRGRARGTACPCGARSSSPTGGSRTDRGGAATDPRHHRNRRQDDHDAARRSAMLTAAGVRTDRRRQHRRPARRRASTMRRSTRSSSSAELPPGVDATVPRRRRGSGSTSRPTTSTGTARRPPTRRPRRACSTSNGRRDVAIGFVDDPIVMRHLDARAGAARHVRALERRLPPRRRRAVAGPSGTIATVASMRRRLPHDITNALAASALVLESGLGDLADAPAARSRRSSAPPHRIEPVGRARRRAVVQRLEGDHATRGVGGDPWLRPRRAHRRRTQQGRSTCRRWRPSRTPPVGRGDRRGGRGDHATCSRRTARSSRADSMEAAVVAAADSARRGDAVRPVARLRQLRLVSDGATAHAATTSGGWSPTWSAVERGGPAMSRDHRPPWLPAGRRPSGGRRPSPSDAPGGARAAAGEPARSSRRARRGRRPPTSRRSHSVRHRLRTT